MNSMSLKLLRFSSCIPLSKFTWSNKAYLLINRLLFTPQSLKIDSFKSKRENFDQIKDLDEFKNYINKKCESGMEYLLFKEEIKQMVMISETDDDLELFTRMLKKFSLQGSMVTFGKVVIGPEIMRMFYVLNKPGKALELFKDPETVKIFFDITSWILLGDLLFKNEMYQEGIDFYYLFDTMHITTKRNPLSLGVLFFASCYKLNSRKSYEKATEMIESLEKVGYTIPARVVWLYTALALKQKEATTVLKFVDSMECTVAKNLKVLALIEEEKFHEVFDLLDMILSNNKADSEEAEKIFFLNFRSIHSNFITKDTLQHLEESLKAQDENFKILQQKKELLFANNLVSNKTLEDFLLHPIKFVKGEKKNWHLNYKK